MLCYTEPFPPGSFPLETINSVPAERPRLAMANVTMILITVANERPQDLSSDGRYTPHHSDLYSISTTHNAGSGVPGAPAEAYTASASATKQRRTGDTLRSHIQAYVLRWSM